MATDRNPIIFGFGDYGDPSTFVPILDVLGRSRDGRIELDFAENRIGATQIKMYDVPADRGELSINEDLSKNWMIQLPIGATLQSMTAIIGVRAANLSPVVMLDRFGVYDVPQNTVFTISITDGDGTKIDYRLSPVPGGNDLTSAQLALQINTAIGVEPALSGRVQAYRSTNHTVNNEVEIYLLDRGSDHKISISPNIRNNDGGVEWVQGPSPPERNPIDGSLWPNVAYGSFELQLEDWRKISASDADLEVWELRQHLLKTATNNLNPNLQSGRRFQVGRSDPTGASAMIDDFKIEIIFPPAGSTSAGGIHFNSDEFRGTGISEGNPVELVYPYTVEEKGLLATVKPEAEKNVQVDVQETDTTSDAYIKNLPEVIRELDFPIVVGSPATLAEMIGTEVGASFNNRFYAASEIVELFAPAAPENVKVEAVRLIIIHLSRTNWVAYDSASPTDAQQNVLRLSGADRVLSGWLLSDTDLEEVQLRNSFIGLLYEYLIPVGTVNLDRDPNGVEIRVDNDPDKVNLDLENVQELAEAQARAFRQKVNAAPLSVADNRAYSDLSNVDLRATAEDILTQLGTIRFTESDRATLTSISSGDQIVAGDVVETPVPLLAGGEDKLTGYVSPPGFANMIQGLRADGQGAVVGSYPSPLTLSTGATKKYLKILLERSLVINTVRFTFLTTTFIYPQQNGQFDLTSIYLSDYIETNALSFSQGHILMKCVDDNRFLLGATDVGDSEESSFTVRELTIGS